MRYTDGDVCPMMIILLNVHVPCGFPDMRDCGFYTVKKEDNGGLHIGCRWQELEVIARKDRWKK